MGQPKPERRFYRDYADAGAATATSAPRISAILATSLAICSAGAPKAAKALVRSFACAAPT